MDVIIRKATWEDAPSMAEIHMRSWEAAYAGIVPDEAIAAKNAGRPDMWRRTLSGEHDDHIALADGVPAGLMCLHACRDADLPAAGEVGAFYLHPDRWGMGLGRAMMGYALDLMRRRGHETVVLWVLEDNRRARRFYEKCGFAEDGTRKEIVIGGPLVELRYRVSICPRKAGLEGGRKMTIEVMQSGDTPVARVRSEESVLIDGQSALDLIATVQYEVDANRIALDRSAVSPDFFRLSTGLAGEVLQKFVNYGAKLAIIGDFSHVQSAPLRDFIYESNRGSVAFFVPTEEEALKRLSAAR